jgi:hypothetical protein
MTIAISPVTPEIINVGEISIGGVFFPIEGPLLRSLISILPGKLVIGDASKNDDTLLSHWDLPDAKGGLLVERAIPSRDIDRGYDGNSETRYANAIGLAPEVLSYAKPVGASPVGVFFELADEAYACFGSDLRRWSSTTGTWVQPGGTAKTLPAAATDALFVHGNTWIACGDAQNIQRWNGTALSAVTAGEEATFLCILDTVLYAIKSDGTMRSAVETGAVVWADEGQLWVQGNITGLHVYRDLQGAPVLYASTNSGLYYYEPGAKIWHSSSLLIPRHTQGGKAATPWRADFFFAAGMSALKYNLTTLSSIGLDRDDGTPGDQNGNIIHFKGSFNWLFAGVRSTEVALGSNPIYSGDLSAEADVFPVAESFSSMWASDGNGIWHRLWRSATTSGDITACELVVSGGVQRLWWYADDVTYAMVVPAGIHNPQFNPTARFQPTAYHITPWFDADWSEQLKLAVRFRIGVKNLSTTERIRVQYGLDDDAGFIDMGWLDSSVLLSPTGVYTFYFGDKLGVPFYRIRFRFDFGRGSDPTRSPLLRFLSLGYIKTIEVIFGYDVTVDTLRRYRGRSPGQLRAFIDAVAGSQTLVPFMYRDKAGDPQQRIVRVTRYRSAEQTGEDDRAKRQLSLSELFPL